MSGQHRANGTDYEAGCRCPTCQAANTARIKRRRAERFASRQLIDGHLVAPLPPDKHGTNSAYSNWGCHCDPCRAAGHARNRAAYQARGSYRHNQRRNARRSAQDTSKPPP